MSRTCVMVGVCFWAWTLRSFYDRGADGFPRPYDANASLVRESAGVGYSS